MNSGNILWHLGSTLTFRIAGWKKMLSHLSMSPIPVWLRFVLDGINLPTVLLCMWYVLCGFWGLREDPRSLSHGTAYNSWSWNKRWLEWMWYKTPKSSVTIKKIIVFFPKKLFNYNSKYLSSISLFTIYHLSIAICLPACLSLSSLH